jgi:hypothetical protein
MRHPIDPEAPHVACDALGRLLVQGLLSRAECIDALARAARATEGDARGFRTRLAWDLLQAARFWARARRWARVRVAEALEPGLARRAPRRVLLAAARQADRAGALTADEREAIALAAVRRRLRGGAPAWQGRGWR